MKRSQGVSNIKDLRVHIRSETKRFNSDTIDGWQYDTRTVGSFKAIGYDMI